MTELPFDFPNSTELLWVQAYAVIVSKTESSYAKHRLDHLKERCADVATEILHDVQKYLRPNEKVIDVVNGYADNNEENRLPRNGQPRRYQWYRHLNFILPGSTASTWIVLSNEDRRNLKQFSVFIYPILYQHPTNTGPVYFSKLIEQKSIRPLVFLPHNALKGSTEYRVLKTWNSTDHQSKPITKTLLRISTIMQIANVNEAEKPTVSFLPISPIPKPAR